LSRWSRLKRARGAEALGRDETVTQDGEVQGGQPRAALDEASQPSDGDAAATTSDAAPCPPGEPDENETSILKIDIEKLTYESDFTPFMKKGVPDEVRNEAMRKLWTSHPVFGIIDGLDDYCEDFSDAVWADPNLKTAYKVGRGFLSEAEAAAWESLGKSATSPPSAAAAASDVADGDGAPESEEVAAQRQHDSQPADMASGDGELQEERGEEGEHGTQAADVPKRPA